MQVTVTNEAKEQIHAAAGHEGKLIRINGELVGGCGMNVEYALWWDEAHPADELLQVDSLTVAIDPSTKEYIDSDRLVIDYRPQQGFRLVTPQQILAYGLKLKERWG